MSKNSLNLLLCAALLVCLSTPAWADIVNPRPRKAAPYPFGEHVAVVVSFPMI